MSYNHRFFVKLGDYSHILQIPTKERDNQLIHGLGENKQGDWLSAKVNLIFLENVKKLTKFMNVHGLCGSLSGGLG